MGWTHCDAGSSGGAADAARGIAAWTLLAATLPVVLGVAAAPAAGQTVRGRVLDGANRQAVMLAEVMLVDSTGAVFAQTVSDHEGHFQLSTDRPGSYYMLVRRLGYAPSLDGVLELGEGGFVPVEFFLRPRPVELDPLTATAARIERHLRNQGFYRRMEQGFGHFVTPEELEETAVRDMVDYLERLPGVHRRTVQGFAGLFVSDPNGCFTGCEGRPTRNPLDPPGMCTPQLYVDGARATNPDARMPGARVDHVVDFESVLAVEVYTRIASIPIEYAMHNTCGAILIWTK